MQGYTEKDRINKKKQAYVFAKRSVGLEQT